MSKQIQYRIIEKITSKGSSFYIEYYQEPIQNSYQSTGWKGLSGTSRYNTLEEAKTGLKDTLTLFSEPTEEQVVYTETI